MPIETNDKWIDARTAGLALGLAFIATIIVAPGAFWGGVITSDGYEHLAIAHSWVHGAGFVDPIQWHYYLTETPPLPAAAVRPPLISVLAAGPLAAGATIPTLILLHAAWSAVMIGALFLVASRFMRRRAAAAIALLVATFPPWVTYLAVTPLSEVTAVGCYLLVLVTARGILRSPSGAVICAASTLIAAMTRPNLSALFVAASVAAIIELGPRAALRHRGLWTYLMAFTIGYVGIEMTLKISTGLGLYDGYGIVSEIMGLEDAWRYDREFEGAWAFAQLHSDEIMMRMRERTGQLIRALCFEPGFHRIGWFFVPSVLYGLLRRRDGVLAHRINAFSTLGFGFVLIANYSAFDPDRYPLWVALPLGLGAMASLDALARQIERRRGSDAAVDTESRVRSTTRLWGWLPLVATCVIALSTLGTTATKYPGSWVNYQSARSGESLHARAPSLLSICERIDPDAIVASAIPWQVLYWCGNAGLRIPIEPISEAVRDRFVMERKARYILLTPPRLYSPVDIIAWTQSLDNSPHFARQATVGAFVLYEFVDARNEAPVWNAPPPLVCAGLHSNCTLPPPR